MIKGDNNMESNHHEFNIYFSDLNEECQRRLLEAVGVEEAADMGWDKDVDPIATYVFED